MRQNVGKKARRRSKLIYDGFQFSPIPFKETEHH